MCLLNRDCAVDDPIQPTDENPVVCRANTAPLYLLVQIPLFARHNNTAPTAWKRKFGNQRIKCG